MKNNDREKHWDERATWGQIAMTSSAWAKGQMDYLIAKGNTWDEAYRVVETIADQENAKLADKVVNVSARLLNEASRSNKERQAKARILEVSTGVGDLTVKLLPWAQSRGLEYYGVDCSDEMLKHTRLRLLEARISKSITERIRKGVATQLNRLDEQPFWLITWGKLGHHLVKEDVSGRSEWELALEQVKEVLEPSGYFLQYEPLQDFNEKYRTKPKQKTWSYFRRLKEYEDNLSPIELVEHIPWEFCGEVYSIIVWRKPI